MLSTEAKDLWEEIHHAEARRDAYLASFDEQIAQWHGDSYHGRSATVSGQTDRTSLEPFAHEYLTLTIPQLVPEKFRVSLQTVLGAMQRDVAVGLGYSIDRWIRISDFRHEMTLVALDMAFNYGVFLTVMEQRPGRSVEDAAMAVEGLSRGDDLVAWPNVYRLPQRWFVMDTVAKDWRSARFMGHKIPVDLEDLQEMVRKADDDEGWDRSAVGSLSAGSGMGDMYDDDTNRREQVVIYEIWIPEIQQDGYEQADGYHGTIVTLAVADRTRGDDGGGVVKIRKDRPYWGPRTGPYAVAGFMPVIDSVFPLSPLMAIDRQMRSLNELALSAHRNTRNYKRLVICSSDNPDLADRIRETGDMYVLDVPGFEKNDVVQIELGGITDQLIAQLQIERERLERLTGISEAQSGRPNPSTTATADSIAVAASRRRVGWVRAQFQAAVKQALKTVLWYMLHDERFVMALGSEAFEALRDAGVPLDDNAAGVVFQGGDYADDPVAIEDLIDDIEIEDIDDFSRPEHLQRAQTALQVLIAVAGAAVQYPMIDWKTVLRRIGTGIGYRDLHTMLDLEALGQVQQQLVAAGHPLGLGDSLAKVGVPSSNESDANNLSDMNGLGKLATIRAGRGPMPRRPEEVGAA